MGVPAESRSAARWFRSCRSRSARTAGSSVGPSAPQFQLRELRTSGLSASLCAPGLGLPAEHRRVAVADLQYTDFTGKLRGSVLRHLRAAREEGQVNPAGLWRLAAGLRDFVSADSRGGGLVASVSLEDVVGSIIEEINAQIVDQVASAPWELGASLVGDTLAATALRAEEAFLRLDADGDGTVSAEEVAAALWNSAVRAGPREP
mmetsp:Transcript_49107/g.148992  ORF Transcript_49107/g.148992 Transcript_49107/m.148992 type:complete len:205 (-) Transcript_49107:3-617(-)